jgi:rSAM/selenodomain-associated transferase 1
MKAAIILFAKEPGEVEIKKRLSPLFSNAIRIVLYKAFLKDIFKSLKGIRQADKILAYSSRGYPVYLAGLMPDFILHKQKGDNLGMRMLNAAKFAESKGYDKSIIIGTDSPNLPLEYIQDAVRGLNKADIVIGPTTDGGYYLIGFKKPCVNIFQGVKWSLDRVFSKTKANLLKKKKKLLILKSWYDIDRPEDLIRLRSDLGKTKAKGVCRYTQRVLLKLNP